MRASTVIKLAYNETSRLARFAVGLYGPMFAMIAPATIFSLIIAFSVGYNPLDMFLKVSKPSSNQLREFQIWEAGILGGMFAIFTLRFGLKIGRFFLDFKKPHRDDSLVPS
jgi:hypothetical protein